MTRPRRTELPPARNAAIKSIRLILGNGYELQAGLDAVLSSLRLSERDRSLATELCYGYLRQKGRIEYLLSLFLQDVSRIPSPAMHLLGIAGYEILFSDRIPTYASVNWCVEEMKKRFGKGLGRMANAVLRRISDRAPDRDKPELYTQDSPGESLFLSRFFSTPEWMVNLWLSSYGFEQTRHLLRSTAAAPPVGIRFNRLRPAALSLFREYSQCKTCLASQGMGAAFSRTPEGLNGLIDQGLASRQSFAAQQALLALAPEEWPEPIWDACAGRGGKSFLLAESGKRVWASDLSRKRLTGFNKDSSRLGVPVPCFQASATRPAPFRNPPGTVLLDVPCSGLGVLSRRPDIKWKRSPKDLARFISLQKSIIDASLRVLPPGGCLVYVTCTINPDENQNQIQRALKKFPELRVEQEFQTPFQSPLREHFYSALLKRI